MSDFTSAESARHALAIYRKGVAGLVLQKSGHSIPSIASSLNLSERRVEQAISVASLIQSEDEFLAAYRRHVPAPVFGQRSWDSCVEALGLYTVPDASELRRDWLEIREKMSEISRHIFATATTSDYYILADQIVDWVVSNFRRIRLPEDIEDFGHRHCVFCGSSDPITIERRELLVDEFPIRGHFAAPTCQTCREKGVLDVRTNDMVRWDVVALNYMRSVWSLEQAYSELFEQHGK